MRFSADCVPCLLNRVLYEVELVAPEHSEEAMAAALEIMAACYPQGMNSAKLATKVHAAAYRISGSDDPYKDLKVRSNEAALAVLDKASQLVDSAPDRLDAACLAAIIGNVMDFGIDVGMEGPEALCSKFDALWAEGIQVDEVAALRRLLKRSKKVLYLMDNCGEIVLDTLLVREIKRFGPEVVGVYKGAPILTDATEEDMELAGLDKAFDRVISTGMFAVGIDMARASPELAEEMESADLIISKGMANFESLSDDAFRPIAFLLRTKCRPVAKAIGAAEGQNVVRVWEH
jgi:uncharacterized protein with ATP-grasp and redox domains